MDRTRKPKRGHSLPYGAGSFHYSETRGRWIGTIEAGWNSQGKRRRITVTSINEDEAWRKLQVKRKQILEEGIPAEGLGGNASVQSWCTKYLEIRAGELKPQPWRSERSVITKWVIPTLGHRKIESLTPGDVRELGDAVAAVNSSTQARYVQRTFQLYMRAALAEGYGVPARILEVRKQSARVSPRQALPLPDVVAVLKAAHQRPDHSRWDAAFLQGLRQGEALGLTWEHVNLERGTITVAWTLQELTRNKATGDYDVPAQFRSRQLEGRFWLLEPKTEGSRRMIPMVPQFRQSLAEWKEIAPASPYGLVWPRADGKPRILSRDRVEFRALQEEAGVSKPGGGLYVPHEARHSTVSILLELGIAREVVEAVVGHSELVEDYVTVSDARIAEALAALGDALAIGSGG